MDEKTLKKTMDVLGPFARDQENDARGVQAKLTASRELVAALNDAAVILKESVSLKSELESLRAEKAQETAALKNLKAQNAEILGNIKPQRAQFAEREKELSAREAAVVAREEKVLAREEKIKSASDHLAALNLLDH